MNNLIVSLNALRDVAETGETLLCQCEFKNSHLFIVWRKGANRWWPVKVSTKLFFDVTRIDFLVVLARQPLLDSKVVTKLYSLYCSENLKIFSTKPEFFNRFLDATLKISTLFRLARNTGRKYLGGQVRIVNTTLGQTGHLYFEVCVAFWKDGKVRGSMIGHGNTPEEAVKQGTVRALNDKRWKPLTLGEWEKVQIELTIFSPLKLPVCNITYGCIDYTKGFMVRYKNHFGLYVPEVFNAISFRGKADFFRSLAVEKAKISPAHLNRANCVDFDVTDHIEFSGDKIIELYATMPKPMPCQNLLKDVESTALKAIGHLATIQEPDGNIPPVTKSMVRDFGQIDFSRMAFILFALREWNSVKTTHVSRQVAENLFSYIKYYLKRSNIFDSPQASDLYGLIYLGHAYQTMGIEEGVVDILKITKNKISQCSFDPILFLEAISLNNRSKKKQDFSTLEEVCQSMFNQLSVQTTTDTASWAEAVVAFKQKNPQFADRVTRWIISHQTSVGYFKQSFENDFGYTRGTSKIFEVLATEVKSYESVLGLAQSWLKSMQYDEHNSFFINPDFRTMVSGGFRHDYNNPDVWIDAAGHYILGASRIFSSALKHDPDRSSYISV